MAWWDSGELLLIGLGLLGELWYWVVKWAVLWFRSPNAGAKKGPRVKYRKVPAPSWADLQKRKGPWRQACQWFASENVITEARKVLKQRVCGVKGARGLGSWFRGSPLRSVSHYDAKRIRLHVKYLRTRWPLGCPENVGCVGQGPCGLSWSDDLRGGAHGSWVTNKKRNEKRQNSSLASALEGFLKQWQRENKPQTLGSGFETKQTKLAKPVQKNTWPGDNWHDKSWKKRTKFSETLGVTWAWTGRLAGD